MNKAKRSSWEQRKGGGADPLGKRFNNENNNLMKPSICQINNKMNPCWKIITTVISSWELAVGRSGLITHCQPG